MSESAFQFKPYDPAKRTGVAEVLRDIGWESRYVIGQLEAIDIFASNPNAQIIVALGQGDVVVGYASIEFYAWNRLAQIHGLAVRPSLQRQGLAGALVEQSEVFARRKGARGVYVDTPVTNVGARAFYQARGYAQDYIMTAYYDDDLDGVTYLKRFGAPH